MMKQRKTFPKWIYKGNFGNNQRVHIYFGHINPPEVSLVYRNAAQDSLSMFVSLAAAAKQVSLQHRTQGFLWSCPVQNPAGWEGKSGWCWPHTPSACTWLRGSFLLGLPAVLQAFGKAQSTGKETHPTPLAALQVQEPAPTW